MLSLNVALSLAAESLCIDFSRLAKCFLQDAHERHSVLAEAVVCHLCLESSGSTKTESNVP